MTHTSTIKDIVQAMISGGWEPDVGINSYTVKYGNHIIDINESSIKIKICTVKILETNRYNEEFSESLYTEVFNGSINDLILNINAMIALCGVNDVCGYCGKRDVEWCCTLWGNRYYSTSYTYHMMQCARIIGERGDVVEYLSELIKEIQR